MNWNKTIFLAHASEDKPQVRKLYKTLKENGLDPWLDEENLLPGVKWDDKIKEAIKNSRFFMACISAQSVSKNGYIQKELRLALEELERKVPDLIYFIPVLMEDVELPNITVNTIKLSDYQASKIFNNSDLQKLIIHLRKQADIIEEVKRKENPIFKNLRSVISEGKVDTALSILRKYIQERDDYMINEIVLTTAKFNNFKNQNMMGLISHEQFTLENNRVLYSMLEMIKQLEEKENHKS
ncbi:TIR domain-containing protein [Algoriphagus sp. SE2]|uniref:TIR domain-containing protein n=1 Tax=Algoriphagus sp. SE2 TaxID=3141536 RepID=UPI0031CD3CC7